MAEIKITVPLVIFFKCTPVSQPLICLDVFKRQLRQFIYGLITETLREINPVLSTCEVCTATCYV